MMNAARWLLHRTLPADEAVIADEIEEASAGRFPGGGLRARLWLWTQVLTLAWCFLREVRRERRLARRTRSFAGGRAGGTPPPPRDLDLPAASSLSMSVLFDELRHALRHLARRPVHTAVIVMILTIGIGPAVAIFTAVNGLLLRPLPYTEPERLGLVRIDLSGLTAHPGIAQAEVLDLRAEMTSATRVEAVNRDFNVTLGAEEDMVFLRGNSATTGLFDMLGVTPVLGRTFQPTDLDQNVVLVSEEFWQTQLDGDPARLGEPIILGGTEHTVVGVLPSDFRLLLGPGSGVAPRVDVWFAMELDPARRNFWGFRTLVQLQPGTSFEQARDEIGRVGEELVARYPDTYESAGIRFDLSPLHQDLVAAVRPALLVLFGAVALVLLIACNNAAGLLLAGTLARAKELAVRQALGAHRRRVLLQVFLESLIVAVLAGVLGVAAGSVGLQGLLAFQPGNLPRIEDMVVDTTVVAFAVGVTFAACLAFGLLPAWQGSRSEAADVLRQGGRSGGGVRSAARGALVVAQVAFSVMLLVGAGLLIRTLQNLHDVDLGFDPENVLTLRTRINTQDTEDAARWVTFERVMTEVGSLPGVTAVGGMQYTPLSGRGFRSSYSADVDSEDEWNGTTADYRWVLPGTVEALGGRLLAGRDITAADLHQNRPVAVIDRTLADQAWPGANAVGQWMRLMVESPNLDPVVEVIGVMEHPKLVDGRTVVMPEIFVPYSAVPQRELTLLVRTTGNPLAHTGAIRDAVFAAGTGHPVHTVRTLDSYVAEARADARFVFLLMTALATVALLLAAAGIYSVLAYLVRQRQHETGVRMALGANSADILRLNVGSGLRLAVPGLGLGLVGALLLSGALESVLFDVAPRDPATLLGVLALMGGVCALASWIPALRASRYDPARALRT